MITEIHKCDRCGYESTIIDNRGERLERIRIYWNPYYPSPSISNYKELLLCFNCLKKLGFSKTSKYEEQKPLDLLDVLAQAVAEKIHENDNS